MQQLRHLPDLDLTEQLRNGNQQAFDVLFMRYKKDVTNLVLQYTSNRTLTEDIVQDAFIKMYTSLTTGRYNHEGKFLPWALRIAHNLFMDYRRRLKAKPQPLYTPEPPEPLTTANFTDAALLHKEREQHIIQLMQQLPLDQRAVVYYRYFEEMSFKEIADLMHTSTNTSLGRMRYALKHLRRHIKADGNFVWR